MAIWYEHWLKPPKIRRHGSALADPHRPRHCHHLAPELGIKADRTLCSKQAMLHLLKRHPIPVRAFFDFTLALTFAFPARLLRPLLYPGLVLDQYGDHAFIAVAMVQTREMRPEFLPPWLGGKFFLTGYRIFVRYRTPGGRTLRGLQVLRSDTDRNAMVGLGNLFTHYHYSRAAVQIARTASQLSITVETPEHDADLSLTADLNTPDESLPRGSIFPDPRTARRFAGADALHLFLRAADSIHRSYRGTETGVASAPCFGGFAPGNVFRLAKIDGKGCARPRKRVLRREDPLSLGPGNYRAVALRRNAMKSRGRFEGV